MRFNRLRLNNWKCYEEEDLSFDTGITVVHGVNGAGKSTLLEACYFALYGTDAFPSGKSREDAITTGETELEVELWFTHGGTEYRIYRRISDPSSSEYVYSDVEFETPTDIVDTEGEAQERIQSIMRMDATAFLNCSYVRQGDITRLIHASPADRQNIIDRLLQLGKLKTYRERIELVLRGARSARDTKRTELETVENRIEELEEQDLNNRLVAVNEQLAETKERLDELDTELDTADTRRDAAIQELDTFDEKRTELDDVVSELETARTDLDEATDRVSKLESRVEKAETELEAARSAVVEALEEADVEIGVSFEGDPKPSQIDRAELETALDAIDADLTEVDETVERIEATIQAMSRDIDTFEDRAETLKNQAEEAETRAESLSERAADRRENDLAAKQDRKDELTDTIQELKDQFAEKAPGEIRFGDADEYMERISDELSEVQQTRSRLEGDIDNITDQIEHAEALIEEGRCPECGQEVDEAPAVTQLDEKRDEKLTLQTEVAAIEDRTKELTTQKSIAAELQGLEDDVAQQNLELETVTDRISDIEDDIDRLEQDAQAERETATENHTKADVWATRATRLEVEQEALTETLTAATDEQIALMMVQGRLLRLDEAIAEYIDAYDRFERESELLETAQETHETHEKNVTRLSDRKEELEAALDEDRITDLEETVAEMNDKISELEAEREETADTREKLTSRRGQIKGKLEDLDDERSKAARFRRQQATLEDAVAQLEDIDQMYGGLRETLREANVSYLEQLLNDIFGLIYENDAYAYIELNRNYEITIHEKGGETLDPDELSGGEQALFNLALRCAIYQLLAEGIDGEAPLPPLILDEPTVHLDETHVGRINDLAERMRQLGVDQTIVVTHSREIVDSADERIAVTQDPSTNRSHATVESADLLAGL